MSTEIRDISGFHNKKSCECLEQSLLIKLLRLTVPSSNILIEEGVVLQLTTLFNGGFIFIFGCKCSCNSRCCVLETNEARLVDNRFAKGRHLYSHWHVCVHDLACDNLLSIVPPFHVSDQHSEKVGFSA